MRDVKWINPELVEGMGVISPPRHVSANPNADEYGSWSRGMRGRTVGIAPDSDSLVPTVAVTSTKVVKGSRYVDGRWIKYEVEMPVTEIRTVSSFHKPRSYTRTSAPRTTVAHTPEVARLPSIHIGADDDN